jgi:acetoin utilization deacetylase AcuC-like enzyme
MITVYSDEHMRHSPPQEFLDGRLIPSFEIPERATIIRDAVAAAGLGPIVPPQAFGDAPILAVHDAGYLQFLQTIYDRWVAAGGNPQAVIPSTLAVRWMARACDDPLAAPGYYLFDGSAPIVAHTWQAARRSAEVALTAAALLRAGRPAAYALCRPPGHHAGSDMGGGYCYLNTAAIAADFLLAGSGASRAAVAILDIDFHHGNGTQQIFYRRSDVLVVSIHGDPGRNYPYFSGHADEVGEGDGQGFNLNLPIATRASDAQYLEALAAALERLAAHRPRFLVVSTGLDTFGGDPVAENGMGFDLTADVYAEIGGRIAALGLPTLFVQEGGYAVAALGHNLAALLRGFVAASGATAEA